MYILVIGNPMDGFKFEGLFTSTQDAIAYGEIHYAATEWWTAHLALKPDMYEDAFNAVDQITTPNTNTPINAICSCGHPWAHHTQT